MAHSVEDYLRDVQNTIVKMAIKYPQVYSTLNSLPKYIYEILDIVDFIQNKEVQRHYEIKYRISRPCS